MEDYYTLLGVSQTSTLDEIKERFRFLAQAYHPDKFGSPNQKTQAEEEFKKINAAYQVLSDPVKRANYDRVRLSRTTFSDEDLRRKQQADAESSRTQAATAYRRAQKEETEKEEAERERQKQEQAYANKPHTAEERKGRERKLSLLVILAVIGGPLLLWLVGSRKAITNGQPFPTQTLNPIAVNTHIAITQTSLVLDDFSNNNRHWPVESDSEGSVEFYNDSYRIQVAPYHGSTTVIDAGTDLRDVIIQVDVSTSQI